MLLRPETDADRETLERLLKNYETTGFGRHPETMQLLHVSIRLRERGE